MFLDAFVVRSLLLPSVPTLLGRRTWSLPHAFERRLPRIAIESAQAASLAPRPGEPAVDEAA